MKLTDKSFIQRRKRIGDVAPDATTDDLGVRKLIPMNAGEPICRRCSHPASWHRHDDEKCLSTHPQPCSLPGTKDAQGGAPLAPFRCIGYDCEQGGYAAGTPETRCGCPDYQENCDGY